MPRRDAAWGPDGNRNRAALIYTPDEVTPQTPILCFLHGAGEAARVTVNNRLIDQPIDVVLAHGSPALHHQMGLPTYARFVMICPQLEVERMWTNADADAVVNLVRREIDDTDGRRKVLTGFSFGGTGVFQFARHNPDFWTALWPVAPYQVAGVPPGNGPVLLNYGDPDANPGCRPPVPPPALPNWFQPNGVARIYRVLLEGVAQSRLGHILKRALPHTWIPQPTHGCGM